MTDNTDLQITALEQANPLREPVLKAVIEALQLAPGSHGLDIGCGIGLQTLLLAEAVRPAGQVTGLDISPGLLAHARQKVRASHLADRIAFKEGSMLNLPFEENTFDWTWSADCVGYPGGDILPVLLEIARVVRPGGMVAILAWTSQQVLPGYSLLEARLNAACSAYAPWLHGMPPEAHFLRVGACFSPAGIENLACRTFVGEVQAPLQPEIKIAMQDLFEMLWTRPSAGESQADWLEYERLCRTGSSDNILDLPEYYAFFTYTLFTGSVEKAS
jgi:demethylmenaquinone methyltransferase/2-methoxy-6-polyprenyl-1,4-benzoquinol methylase